MTKLFNEVSSNPVENLTSLGEGNIVFSNKDNKYMLSTFDKALLKFKERKRFPIIGGFFSDVELLTNDQFEIILQRLAK